jgi:hypothetical protein
MIALNLDQLEFETLVASLQPTVARMQRKPRKMLAVASASPEMFAVVLLRAVTEENLAFACYAVMLAVSRHATATLAGIAIECGYSYHATRHIVLRSHYLQKIDGVPVGLQLTEEGTEKLSRVSKRLARYV